MSYEMSCLIESKYLFSKQRKSEFAMDSFLWYCLQEWDASGSIILPAETDSFLFLFYGYSLALLRRKIILKNEYLLGWINNISKDKSTTDLHVDIRAEYKK